MGYIEANLASDEEVVARIKHSWAGLVSVIFNFLLICGIGAVLLCIQPIIESITGESMSKDVGATAMMIIFDIVGGLLIAGSLFGAISAFMEIACAQLVVTNKRMFGRRGVISKQTTDIMLNKVDTINTGNGFFGAIFHYGDIQIVSAASGTNKATLRYNFISNTMEFRKAVLEAIEKAKMQDREEQAKVMRDAIKPNEK